jgi:hypothetical protein
MKNLLIQIVCRRSEEFLTLRFVYFVYFTKLLTLFLFGIIDAMFHLNTEKRMACIVT